MTAVSPNLVSPTTTPNTKPVIAAARKPRITSCVVIHSATAIWPPDAMFLLVSHSSSKVSAGPGRRILDTYSSSAISHQSASIATPRTMTDTDWGMRSIHLPAYQSASASDISTGPVCSWIV